jgi:hypothetical protein
MRDGSIEVHWSITLRRIEFQGRCPDARKELIGRQEWMDWVFPVDPVNPVKK